MQWLLDKSAKKGHSGWLKEATLVILKMLLGKSLDRMRWAQSIMLSLNYKSIIRLKTEVFIVPVGGFCSVWDRWHLNNIYVSANWYNLVVIKLSHRMNVKLATDKYKVYFSQNGSSRQTFRSIPSTPLLVSPVSTCTVVVWMKWVKIYILCISRDCGGGDWFEMPKIPSWS